jgi:hypothetical protein
MVSPISHAPQATAETQLTAARQTAPPSKPQPTTDKVTLSAATQLKQELTETPTQTSAEALRGDIQAKHLQAKEAADKANGL